MQNRITNIGQRALVTLVAKEIKKCHRNIKNKGSVDIPVSITPHDMPHVMIGDKEYRLNDSLSKHDIHTLIEQALQESRCNGISFDQGKIIRVMVFAKPRKSFCMLARLLLKYAGYNLKWDEIKRIDLSNTPDGDKYLCHEDDLCQDAIDFIRQKKDSRDKLFAEVVTSTNGDVIEKMLQLTVATPKGKFKHGKILVIDV
jgi:hypothetical protein